MMEFALKELPDCAGFSLCDAKTGEIIPGQVACNVRTDPSMSDTEVTLRFLNLPLFKDRT